MKKLGMWVEKIHVHLNECMLYYKETSHLQECLYCKAPRYNLQANNGDKQKKNVPSKVLRHFPIILRLQRQLLSQKFVEHMSWHAKNPRLLAVMTHAHSVTWKHLDRCHPSFASDACNVQLRLCIDSFNPFGYSSKLYSIWSVIITTYNLPRRMRLTHMFLFLSLIIHRRNEPVPLQMTRLC